MDDGDVTAVVAATHVVVLTAVRSSLIAHDDTLLPVPDAK